LLVIFVIAGDPLLFIFFLLLFISC